MIAIKDNEMETQLYVGIYICGVKPNSLEFKYDIFYYLLSVVFLRSSTFIK